ncbi:MAG TPA: glycoside hydrolase family 44 protein [Acidobacteriaceae bacterium]|nr:glycoside hydrolase family 44 protein [Acidobacteriaceae bacterium]
MIQARWTTVGVAIGLSLCLIGCGGSGSSGTPPITTYVLTVNSTNPATGVAITVSPADNNGAASGTTSFTRTYNSGVSVTLTAPAASGGNTFSSWTGCTSVSVAVCTVTLTANTTVTANYSIPAPATYTLNIDSTNPTGGVAISASPADNNSKTGGTTDFRLTYNSGTAIVLTAPSTSGTDTFSSWSGCTTTTGTTCNVTLTANTTVTANYTMPVTPPTTYVLTVASTNPANGVAVIVSPTDNNSAGSGATSFTRVYNSGAAVTLTAPATSGGNTFSSWTGCITSSSTTCNVTLAADTTVTANYTVPVSTTYVLTVNSAGPSSGVAISATADNNGASNGSTRFTRTYNAGKSVTLQAPATTGSNSFVKWTGCTAAINETCSVTMSANTTVTANYNGPNVTSVTITPNAATVTIGSNQRFSATVNGTGLSGNTVTWSVAAPSGSIDSPGTITSTGLYTSPYPAPSTVTVTATSTQDPSISGSVTATLAAPAAAAGPALSVDAGTQTRAISPYIYGMNAYLLDATTASNANIPVARWGGDDTSRYNYQTNVVNSANDYYFENFTGSSGMLGGGLFNNFVTTTDGLGIATLGTAPVIGWVSNSTVKACSFSASTNPNQKQFNGDGCGNGVATDGTSLFGNNTIAAITSIPEPPPNAPGAGNATSSWATATWIGGWVHCLLTSGSYCASTGGKDVSIWDLDNEPEYWSAVHRDVHPNPMAYDEITNGGIGTALAIKTADPGALVSGPIISGWYQYFYSQQDVNDGYSTGPCYSPWSDPTDRTAHGGAPLIEYYLQQMAAASKTYGVRLLDYVDIHAYFAANYNGATVGLTTAGDTGEQQARMNSTRVFWDPTYTDPAYTQPNYSKDANYYDPTTKGNCNIPLQAPKLIPMMQSWVTNDYPGTKTSIDEYNFGGNESINGAVTQADILGIFGAYGLDMAELWPTTNYTAQGPGNMAFEIYRNYDGNKSTFGNTALSSTSANQGSISIYGAVRSSDSAITIVVINKTYGALTSTLSLANYPEVTATTAESFLYSNANLTAIVAQPNVTVTPPAAGSTTSTINATFPAQSITLLVVPAI